MEKGPTFSIIVPIYNVEDYLRCCIDSVLSQAYGDYELILVDDGSPDDSARIIDEYAAKDSRVRPVHKQNGGVVSARIEGARLARGEYVLALDGDDSLNENALADLAGYIERVDADIYCFGFLECREDGQITVLSSHREGLYETPSERAEIYSTIIYDKKAPYYSFGLYPSVWSRAVKRELYLKWQLSTDMGIVVGEDLALTVPMMFDAEKIYIIQKPFYRYRVLPNSMSRGFIKNEPEYLRRIVKRFRECDVIDIDKHDLALQFGAYCAGMTFSYLYGASKRSKSIKEFRTYVDNIDSTVWRCIKKCRSRFSSTWAFTATFVTKHELWHLFMLMAKIKG